MRSAKMDWVWRGKWFVGAAFGRPPVPPVGADPPARDAATPAPSTSGC